MEEKDKKYKQILLETFSSLIKVLEDNNLRWFVGYGTLIGTIRHKGFIPWDDDIDIIMPRVDYNRLLNLSNSIDKGYQLLTPNTKDYPYRFSKYCDNHTTLVETQCSPITIGVYVDIFPYDDFDCSFHTISKLRKRYQKIHRSLNKGYNFYSPKYVISCILGFRVYSFFEMLKAILYYRVRRNYYVRRMEEIEAISTPGIGDFAVCLSGLLNDHEILQSKWLDGSINMEFEGISVRVPIGFDSYLRNYYGDYMQLPPIDKRVARHPHVYENLEKKMTIIEARKCFNHSIAPKH